MLFGGLLCGIQSMRSVPTFGSGCQEKFWFFLYLKTFSHPRLVWSFLFRLCEVAARPDAEQRVEYPSSTTDVVLALSVGRGFLVQLDLRAEVSDVLLLNDEEKPITLCLLHQGESGL